MSNQAIKRPSMVGMDEQLFANVLNIDFFVYSFGSIVSNKREANTGSTSDGAGGNMEKGGGTHEQDTGGDDREMTGSKL